MSSFEQRKQVVDVGDDELRDFKKLSWSDLINFQLARVLKTESKDAFALDVDKLESLMGGDLPSEYHEKLSSSDSSKPYSWRKFDLLLKYMRRRTPKEVEGKL